MQDTTEAAESAGQSRLTFTVDDEQRAQIERAAKRRGHRRVADFMRLAVLRETRAILNEPEPVGVSG